MIVLTLFKKGKKLIIKGYRIKRKRNQDRKDEKVKQPDQSVHKIIEKLNNLEDAIKELNKKPVAYNINVENVNITDPVLKELIFNLDKLDIKELSGSLTIGNHFGAAMEKEKTKKEKKTHKSSHVHIRLDQQFISKLKCRYTQ